MHIHSLVDQKIRQIKLVKTHKVQMVKTVMVKLVTETETVMVMVTVLVVVTDRTLVKHIVAADVRKMPDGGYGVIILISLLKVKEL